MGTNFSQVMLQGFTVQSCKYSYSDSVTILTVTWLIAT